MVSYYMKKQLFLCVCIMRSLLLDAFVVVDVVVIRGGEEGAEYCELHAVQKIPHHALSLVCEASFCFNTATCSCGAGA